MRRVQLRLVLGAYRGPRGPFRRAGHLTDPRSLEHRQGTGERHLTSSGKRLARGQLSIDGREIGPIEPRAQRGFGSDEPHSHPVGVERHLRRSGLIPRPDHEIDLPCEDCRRVRRRTSVRPEMRARIDDFKGRATAQQHGVSLEDEAGHAADRCRVGHVCTDIGCGGDRGPGDGHAHVIRRHRRCRHPPARARDILSDRQLHHGTRESLRHHDPESRLGPGGGDERHGAVVTRDLPELARQPTAAVADVRGPVGAHPPIRLARCIDGIHGKHAALVRGRHDLKRALELLGRDHLPHFRAGCRQP